MLELVYAMFSEALPVDVMSCVGSWWVEVLEQAGQRRSLLVAGSPAHRYTHYHTLTDLRHTPAPIPQPLSVR